MNIVLTGTSGNFVLRFKEYVKQNKTDINTVQLSLRGDSWKDFDFTGIDAVIHCAGITHSAKDTYQEFEEVNVKLTKQFFAMCVKQKVPYFMYLSSMAVYDGTDWGFGHDGIITGETKPVQKTYYGRSKYEAEQSILEQECGITKVSIVRAPAIVGKGMEDYFRNYIRFSKIPLLPVPRIHKEAKRSIVYVDTLIEFMCELVQEEKTGVFFPQNYPMLSVSEMFSEVCKAQEKKRVMMPVNSKLLPGKIEKKLFRQICYSEDMSNEENKKVGSISTYEAIKRAVAGGSNDD